MAPNECETMYTERSSAGNSSRQRIRSSVMVAAISTTNRSTVVALVGAVRMACRPLGEQFVTDVPQLGEEAVLHALGELVGRLALERRCAQADLAVHDQQMAHAPRLQALIVIDERLG